MHIQIDIRIHSHECIYVVLCVVSRVVEPHDCNLHQVSLALASSLAVIHANVNVGDPIPPSIREKFLVNILVVMFSTCDLLITSHMPHQLFLGSSLTMMSSSVALRNSLTFEWPLNRITSTCLPLKPESWLIFQITPFEF